MISVCVGWYSRENSFCYDAKNVLCFSCCTVEIPLVPRWYGTVRYVIRCQTTPCMMSAYQAIKQRSESNSFQHICCGKQQQARRIDFLKPLFFRGRHVTFPTPTAPCRKCRGTVRDIKDKVELIVTGQSRPDKRAELSFVSLLFFPSQSLYSNLKAIKSSTVLAVASDWSLFTTQLTLKVHGIFIKQWFCGLNLLRENIFLNKNYVRFLMPLICFMSVGSINQLANW